jgi:hypothetical protein
VVIDLGTPRESFSSEDNLLCMEQARLPQRALMASGRKR